MWHFTADLHLGHGNIIKYCRRPFMTKKEEELLAMSDRGVFPNKEVHISQESTKLMTDTIIDNINAAVAENDTLVINGDFCWTPKFARKETIAAYRNRIRCKNVFLVLGNHDDNRMHQYGIFKDVFDHYSFNVDGQDIFVDHYPSRSWEKASHGSWMLYGHVHNLFYPEDNGLLMPYQKYVFTPAFHSILEKYGVKNDSGERDRAVQELLDLVASTHGISLTVDVGVDNPVRGDVPFGTPWSMRHLQDYFAKKKPAWNARNDIYKKLKTTI